MSQSKRLSKKAKKSGFNRSATNHRSVLQTNIKLNPEYFDKDRSVSNDRRKKYSPNWNDSNNSFLEAKSYQDQNKLMREIESLKTANEKLTGLVKQLQETIQKQEKDIRQMKLNKPSSKGLRPKSTVESGAKRIVIESNKSNSSRVIEK